MDGGHGCGNSTCEGMEATASALSGEAKSVQDASRAAGLFTDYLMPLGC